MTTAELFGAFEQDTSDVRAFEALIKHLIDAGDTQALEQVYDQVPSWAPGGAQNPLIRVLSQQARVSKGKEIADYLHYKNGVVLWKHYDEPQMAEMSFRRVEAPPEDPELLRQFYLDYYIAQNNWRKLEQFLADPTKGGMSDPVEVKRFLGRLAQQHDQADKAMSFWQGVLSDVPDDDEAESALRRLYADNEKWHAMVDLLRSRFDRLPDDAVDEKIALLREQTAIYKDKTNTPTKVVSTWQQVLDVAPGHEEALDALAAEFTELKRWPDLVKILQQKVAHERDPGRLIALHKEIATIMQERFSNTSEAIRSYEAILEIDAEHQEAIANLLAIYEQRRDYDNYILIAEREIGLMPEGADKHARFVELARLASERIRRPATPIALWERVLNADEDHAEALGELETLYEREKNYKSLASILDKRVELEADPTERMKLLEKLGLVTSVRLGDEDRAADVWRQLLELDRDHRKAQVELKKKLLAEQDWDGLEWFFRNFGDTAEWVRTLESQAKALPEPETQTELLFKAAAIWQEELGETRRAVKNLEGVLALDPQHAGAARMLIPIYHELANWQALTEAYDIVLESSDDPHERREILLAQAQVQEEHRRDPEAAFFAYSQAVRENPSDTRLHPELRRLAERSENWEPYVYVLQEIVEPLGRGDQVRDDQTTRDDQIGVLLEIGRVYRDRLGTGDLGGDDDASATALTFFNRVLALDPYNKPALAAAEIAHTRREAWDQLIVVHDRQLHVADDADERRAILFALASVWRDRVGANEEAEAILRGMLDDFPDDVRVHDGLVAIYLEEERYPNLRDVLEAKRDVLVQSDAADSVLADLECELGMLTYGTRGPGESLETTIDHYEAALGHDPGHEASIQRLVELLADDTQRARITRILEPVFQNQMSWSPLAQILEIQLQDAVANDEISRQMELLARLSELYKDRLDDRDLAWRTFARLFVLQPERGDVRAELQRGTAALERWPQLVALYTDNADEPLDRGARLAIKLEVARTWHTRLGSLEDARVFYHKVLDEEPEHKEALDALEGIYVDLDRAEDLLGVYRRKIELSDDVDQKIDYLFRTSDILHERLENPEEAINATREALDLLPGHLPAVQRLDALYTVTGQWADLARVIEQTLDIVADDAERVVLLKVRLADVHARHLEDPQMAIELYAQVLQSDPENLATIEALEGLFEDESLAQSVAPILQPFYDRHGDWQKLIDVYCVREAASGDVADKVDWNYKIAELYEHLGGMPESAFSHFEAAAALDPGNPQTLGELLRLADQLDNHGELILFLSHIVDDILDSRRRVETHRTVSRLARDRTHDLAGAEVQLRAILEIDPADRAATDELIALYRDGAQHQKHVEMLLHKAPMVSDADDKHALYARAGEIAATSLDDPEQAIEIYETLHGLDPNEGSALDALERLYERVEDWDNLVRIYREKIERTTDLGARKGYAALMGHVQSVALESPHDAIATWHRILEWDGTDEEALDQLDSLYQAQEDWLNLEDILRRKQALADDAGWQAAQFRVARLYESDDQLADVLQAIDNYGALLARNPEHDGAISALKHILSERVHAYDRAFNVLRPVLADGGQHEDLWQQYEVVVGHQADEPARKVQTLHQMAQLAEHQLGQPDRALDALSRAFFADMRDAATIAELQRLADVHGAWEQLVDIYTRGADEADDDLLALELRLDAGAILMDRLDAPERAIEAYRKVYADFPDNPVVLERLHRLYEAEGMAAELVDVLRHQVDIAVDPDARIEHLTMLALVSEAHLEDTDRAFEAHLEILTLSPAHPVAVAELRRLFDQGIKRLDIGDQLEVIYRTGERWNELESLMRGKLEVLTDDADRLQLMRDLARLNLEQRGHKTEALAWFGRAFRLDPEDDMLLVQLEQLARETDKHDDLAVILMDAAYAAASDDPADDERRVQLWHKAAQVSLDALGDPGEAERVYRLILGVAPENAAALAALDRLYTAQERWLDLEPVLVRRAALDDIFDDERVQLYVRLAKLYRDQLGDRDRSVAAWKSVLELNDIHEEALKALQAIYQQDERWPELFGVLERLAEISRDDATRVSYLSDMASIAEALNDQKRATELWEDVLLIAPKDVEAVHELQRLLEAQEMWQALADAYERELRMGIDDQARRLELHRRAGRLWQGQLDDPFQAQSSWQSALAEDPQDRETLDALRAIHADGGNDEGLAQVLEQALKTRHYSDDERLAIHRKLAELYTEVFGDQERGIAAWRAVLAHAPGDTAAIEHLEHLYEANGRWDDLVALYRTKLSHIADEDARFDTWVSLGAIQQDNLQDIDAAAQTYRDILDERAGHAEASRRLEAIYTQTERWEPLSSLLLDRSDHLESAEERLLNYQRLATIYEHRLHQPDGAFLVLSRANQELPDDSHVLAELERLARDTGLWSELYDTYEHTLAHVSGETATDVMLKAARLQEHELDSPLVAITLYERVLSHSEENEAALRALVRLNEAQGRHTELANALWGLAEVTPDYTEKIQLLQKRGRVYADDLGDTAAAVDAWRAVLDVDEMDRPSLDALEQLYIARGEWEALIEIYERVAQLEPERESQLKLKSAGILEAHLGRAEDAIDIYEDVLTFDTGNHIARERLEALYAEREEWAKLLDVYERGFNAAQNDDDRILMARNIAILQDEVFTDPVAAAEAFQQIMTLAPGDQDAFDALERIYTGQAEWDDLIGLYESRFEMAESSDARADALAAMARVYRDRLHDVDNAIGMYERALLERRDDRDVLDALDALYRDQGLWEQVLEVTERKLEVESDPDARVVLLVEQGAIAERELLDTYRAAETYQRVLKERPGQPDAVDALVGIYRRDERWEKVAETLQHKLAHAPSELAASQVHVDLAEVHRDRLGQPDEALAHLESAVSKDAESRRALAALADHYMKVSEWVKARPLLDMLVDKLDPEADREELFLVRKRLGRCAEAMGDYAAALDEYGWAAGLLPADRETLQALARLHFKRESYADAERYLQEVVDRYRAELSSEEYMQTYMELGQSALKLGHFDKAQRYLDEVVEHQPTNTAALEQIIEVLVAYEDWASALSYMERLLSLLADDLERYQLQLRIGDIHAQRLDDTESAMDAYRAALELGVFPKEPALRLFELSVKKRDYVDAITQLNRLIKLEEDARRRSKYAFSAAVLYRDELKDVAQAIKYFNLTLDHDPQNLEAFQIIDQLLTKAREWKPLEQNYRRMIERVQKAGKSSPEAGRLLYLLYKGLGEIYRSRMKRLDYAIHAFELARKQSPDDEAVREILASLYEVTPDGAPKAIEHHRFLIEQKPNRYVSYHQLVQLLKKSGQPDAAWTVAGLLIALGQATDEETRFYRQYLTPGMAEPQRPIDQTMWLQNMVSRGEDPEIGQIFELVYMGLGKHLAAQPIKAFGLKKKSRLDLDEGKLVSNTIKSVARMFGMQPPEVYLGEEATGIEILPTSPPALRLGTDMMTGRTDRELAFEIAKKLSYFHPWHVIATLYGRDQLDHLYMAAASLVDPGYQLSLREDLAPEERSAIANAVGEIRAALDKSMPSDLKQQLTSVMQSFWSRKAAPAMGAWHRHIELTANHAATVAADDVALAGQLIRDDSVGMSKLTRHEKLKDFVQFVVGEQYGRVRRQLGLQIEYSELLG